MSIFFWIYLGYPLFIFILSLLKNNEKKVRIDDFLPKVTIVIAVYNEERIIADRIANCLESNYPKDKIQILIASDGSDDKTVEIAKQYENMGVKVLDFKENRGKALVHNDCLSHIENEIVVFTDAETIFDKNFLLEIVSPFQNEKTGGVVGKLIYTKGVNQIANAEGFYFRYETKIRQWESKLSILVFGSGACMAMRKKLFRKLTPIDDTDFTSLQDVIIQKYNVVFNKRALAYDFAPTTIRGEYKSRVRITAKNLVGTLKRWKVKNYFIHPFVTFGMISHRLLRWFTPYFLILLFVSNYLILDENLFFQITMALQLLYYTIVFFGYVAQKQNVQIPLLGLSFSFFIANIGMFVGVLKGIFGRVPSFYVQKNLK